MDRERNLDQADGLDTSVSEEHRRVELPPSAFVQGSSDDVERPSPFDDTGAGEDTAANRRAVPQDLLKGPAAAVAEPADLPDDSGLPRPPQTVAELGLSKAFLTDLALKIIHYSGTPSASQLADRLGLRRSIVEQILSALTDDRFVEVIGQSDLYTGNYRYRLSGEVANTLARALYSGKTTLLYGPSGNGKTTILERFAEELEGVTLVPHAIYAHGQVIRVFDPSIHKRLEATDSGSENEDDNALDRRWVLVRRPAIILGAELGLESLDISHDPQSRFYQAPPHIKAQGGVFFVDDFGRQRIDARDLLTRWLISLERGWDSLSLVTGEKVTLPFRAQFLLATNLDIRKLVDDALLRRILYKVEMPNPVPQDFAEIMRRMCRERQVLVADGGLNYVLERLYRRGEPEPHASQARDLIDMIVESAAFDSREPVLNPESFDTVSHMFAPHVAETDIAS